MAAFNGNNAYLAIDNTSVNAYWVELELEPSIETVDVTAGSGTTHRQRSGGLEDHTASCVIIYDDTNLSTYIQRLRPGLHTFDYGPEGNAAGKPRHTQQFYVTKAPHKVTVEKDRVVFTLSLEAAAAPTNNMYAGAVWP